MPPELKGFILKNKQSSDLITLQDVIASQSVLGVAGKGTSSIEHM
eukprot:COSAG01_NODE_1_length_100484_cov_170.446142_53_plen_45_part_00